ncbi:MAG: DoxX family protein [Bacteroidota bacterium]
MLYTRTAYLLARLAIGCSMLTHGLVRMPKLTGFSNWMLGQFQKSMLPAALIKPFSYALPFAELITGILLVAGLFTRIGLIMGSIIMLVLIFGSGMIENWDVIPSQLIHIVFFTVLLIFIAHNDWALDNLFNKNFLFNECFYYARNSGRRPESVEECRCTVHAMDGRKRIVRRRIDCAL